MRLITHDGKFHHDEVLATVILKAIYPEAEVIRTRDPEIIKTGDIVYDVGGVFDSQLKKFDHHQKSFTETFSKDYPYKLSSAGLIFKYFKNEFFELYNIKNPEDLLVNKVYESYFLGVDGIDNGYDTNSLYKTRGLNDLVSNFNTYNDKLQNSAFNECMKIIKIDLDNFMEWITKDWYPQQTITKEAIENCEGEIIFTKRWISGADVLNIEGLFNKDIKFIIVEEPGKDVRIYAVPLNKNSFKSKCPLKAEWGGLRDKELCDISKIDGCTFVHASGFTGGNKTVKGAMEMCKASLNERKE